ncbi:MULTISPECIES: enoyl-CoA hydratase-related protein [unclassified Acinetobacter]|uniref:enoyl-CoA hydratase-related protein n=1 Tax=unclassified Acinetobacter TaxID=196816 RepID=UPI0015D41908|nr:MULTISPECIES: enoyl-CoA hydratase-related protein [unclassified Acinetobacter]
MDLMYCKEQGLKLEQLQDFKSFKFVLNGFAHGEYPQIDGIAIDQDDHVWIDQQLVTQFSAGADWNQSFDDMVAKAKKYGWIHVETNAVKAHVVWQEPCAEAENIVTEQHHGCTVIRLNRPAKMNALTVPMLKQLHQALQAANDDPRCRAILITGNGRGFCAGQDLNERKDLTKKLDLGASLRDNYNPVITAIEQSSKPVICAVNGIAAGAGVGIALACDIVLAAENAKFVLSFSKIGLGPDAGLSWTLPRLIGLARAKAIALLAEPVTAQAALYMGMIWQVCTSETLQATAEKLATQLAQRPILSMQNIKTAFQPSSTNTLQQQLELEAALQNEAGLSEDYCKSVTEFFSAKKASA